MVSSAAWAQQINNNGRIARMVCKSSSFARERGLENSSRRSPGLRGAEIGVRRAPYVYAAAAFPDHSSGQLQFPRLQLRGSAGFSPASQSSSEDTRTKVDEKDRNQRVRTVTAGTQGVNRRQRKSTTTAARGHSPREALRIAAEIRWFPRGSHSFPPTRAHVPGYPASLAETVRAQCRGCWRERKSVFPSRLTPARTAWG